MSIDSLNHTGDLLLKLGEAYNEIETLKRILVTLKAVKVKPAPPVQWDRPIIFAKGKLELLQCENAYTDEFLAKYPNYNLHDDVRDALLREACKYITYETTDDTRLRTVRVKGQLILGRIHEQGN